MTPDLIIYLYIAVGSAISAIITAYLTYSGVKRRTMTHWLNSLLEANESFRNEVRKDLEGARQDSSNLREILLVIEDKYRLSIEQIASLQKCIIDYQIEISELKNTIIHYQSEITLLKEVIDDYRVEVENLREEIQKLNNSQAENI